MAESTASRSDADSRTELEAAVARVARLLARAGLVEAFGHVSARTEDGFAITATSVPLADATPATVLRLSGQEPRGDGVPLEAPLHAAVYAARGDVGAICRTHSPAIVVAGAGGLQPPLVHGLGGLSGELATFDDPQLVDESGIAERAAAALGTADCLIMRGNGALAAGPGLERAAVRAWYLEERARVWLQAGGDPKPLSEAELVERSRHWGAESERAWRWLRSHFSEPPKATRGEGPESKA